MEDELELRHAEAELELQRRQADQRRAGELDLPGEQRQPPARVRPPGGAAALDEQQPGRDRRQRGAADHQHVGRAPERDVLAEEAVPDVVEREAEHGDRAAQQQQRAAQRHAPAGREGERRAVAVVGAEHAGEEAGQRDAAEPEQDRVVRDVGERAASRPSSMWVATSQKKPKAAIPSEPSVSSTGSAAQPGTGMTRSARPARRVSSVTRPERWVAPSTSAAAVRSAGHDRRGHEVLHRGATGGLAGGEQRGSARSSSHSAPRPAKGGLTPLLTVGRLLAVGYPG